MNILISENDLSKQFVSTYIHYCHVSRDLRLGQSLLCLCTIYRKLGLQHFSEYIHDLLVCPVCTYQYHSTKNIWRCRFPESKPITINSELPGQVTYMKTKLFNAVTKTLYGSCIILKKTVKRVASNESCAWCYGNTLILYRKAYINLNCDFLIIGAHRHISSSALIMLLDCYDIICVESIPQVCAKHRGVKKALQQLSVGPD